MTDLISCFRKPGGAIITLAVLVACSAGNDDLQTLPPSVLYSVAAFSDITIEAEYSGQVNGSRQHEVRSRVQGIYLERRYQAGQMVSAGDELFLIDPEPYRIAVRAAEAEHAHALAVRSQAEREWLRLNGLFEQNAVSEREHDQARSALELAEAGLALAEARLSLAELDLRWTRVTAPLSGVTDLASLPEGSLINIGTLLTTITRTDPVHVHFALPEHAAATLRQTMSDETRDGIELTAQLILPDGQAHEIPGRINLVSTSIDPNTNSVSTQAVFPNPEGVLVPGQSVSLRMAARQFDDIILIPAAAIGQDRQGARVFIISDNGQAVSRPVRLGPVVDQQQIILNGIEAGERVIINPEELPS